MNDFGKTFVLAFYSSFMKIKLNCDKENTLILNTCNLQKKMMSNLTCVLIYSLTKCVLEGQSFSIYSAEVLRKSNLC